MNNAIKEAIKVFKDYYACPECSDGKNVIDNAAVYHSSALTHRNYECRDCRQTFLVPAEVKISAPKPFRRDQPNKGPRHE